MTTCALKPVDIAPVFPSPASACRKRPFVPVDQDSDADFASLFSTYKKVRSEDYTFIKNNNNVVHPSSGYRKRTSETVEEEFDVEPRIFKKVRSEDYAFKNNSISSREEWVNLLVKEMMVASSVDDAKARGARMFDAFKESFAAEEDEETDEKMKAIAGENGVLKRSVVIQDKRWKKYEEMKNQEVLQLKELVGKYQDQVKSLEVQNYGLNMHLQQALRPNPAVFGGGFHRPDVF